MQRNIDLMAEMRKFADRKPVHAAAGATVLVSRTLRELPWRLVQWTRENPPDSLPGRATEAAQAAQSRAIGVFQTAQSRANGAVQAAQSRGNGAAQALPPGAGGEGERVWTGFLGLVAAVRAVSASRDTTESRGSRRNIVRRRLPTPLHWILLPAHGCEAPSARSSIWT